MSVREEIESLIKSGITDKKQIVNTIVKKGGCNRKHVYKIYNRIIPNNKPAPQEKPAIRTLKVMDLVNQERLDHGKIVRTALKEFKLDDCAYDDQFVRDLMIAKDRWKDVRDLEEFHDNQVVLPSKKRVWCLPDKRLELLKLDGVKEV